jgi:hypothetical protein
MTLPVTLILTHSRDLTTDHLIDRIGGEKVFRVNLDLWRDYRLRVEPGDFFLANPTGRSTRRKDVAKLYWRRAVMTARPDRIIPFDPEERFRETEIEGALLGIAHLLIDEGKAVLVEPRAGLRVGKFVQMERARKYFPIPAWRFVVNEREESVRSCVAKSLTSPWVLEDRALWTTRVDPSALDPLGPWFLQDIVEAERDVTVVYVRGQMFGFSLDRTLFKDRGVDWRQMGEETISHWNPWAVSAETARGIRDLMGELGLDFGRLDFLEEGDRLWFLEVNSNGEWDWLDPDGTNGLSRAIEEEIDPGTPVHPITQGFFTREG